MIQKNFYVLFSDSKRSDKVSKEEYFNVRFIARGLNAVLSEVPHRSGVTLSVSFTRPYFSQSYLNSL